MAYKTKSAKSFLGMKSKLYDDGRSFVVDEHDVNLIGKRLRQKEYPKFEEQFKQNSATPFRIIQDIEFERNRGKRTMADIRLQNKAIGNHFFDRDSMRFFDSRIESGLLDNKYFITSEQFHGSDGYSESRKYTIREAKPDGKIETIGEFNSFKSKLEAKEHIKNL